MILSILNYQEINCLGKGKDIGTGIIILEYILIGHLTIKLSRGSALVKICKARE